MCFLLLTKLCVKKGIEKDRYAVGVINWIWEVVTFAVTRGVMGNISVKGIATTVIHSNANKIRNGSRLALNCDALCCSSRGIEKMCK